MHEGPNGGKKNESNTFGVGEGSLSLWLLCECHAELLAVYLEVALASITSPNLNRTVLASKLVIGG